MTDRIRRRAVIVGATSAIAEHCARLWVADPAVDLVLVGRNAGKTRQVAADLRVRSPQATITVVEADVNSFTDPLAIRALVDAIAAGGALDQVLIAHGSLPDQSACQQDLAVCNDALVVNGVSPALFAEAFAGHMERAGRGSLILIGSVAGDRGRKSNYTYGAAKGLVTRYAQGLQHRLAKSAVTVTLVKPGPTDTPMTAAMKQKGMRLASVESVAARIVAAGKAGKPVVYAPGQWALIMLVIQHIPGAIFNKLDL